MIQYYSFKQEQQPRFSIIIPTWNNLPYLKTCVESIRKNSAHHHQIVLHINEGSDGTREWANAQQIDHSASEGNAGICLGVNAAFSLCRADHIVYMNDDMYACPDWDLHLAEEIERIGHDWFFLSSTMIEPRPSPNTCVIAPHDFGDLEKGFREDDLLSEFQSFPKQDWQGATWPPNIVHRRLWELVGGYSVEFSPGMYSDPDFSMKLWNVGVRVFKGVSKSRVYHFQAKSTGRAKKNDGRKQFYLKWDLPTSFFFRKFLRMGEDYSGMLPEPVRDFSFTKARIKSYFQKLRP